MKVMKLIQIMIILVLSIRFAQTQTVSSVGTFEASAEPLIAAVDTLNITPDRTEKDEITNWLITNEDSTWSVDVVEMLQQVLQNTFGALSANGIDGKELLDGYRFRRDTGRFIDDKDGLMAKIDHNSGEITLADTAFTVMQGFSIYHELGHAVDYRLNRQLSEQFHRYIGGPVFNQEDEEWQTADNYWLRQEGRDDREEATADAFAILVMVSHSGLKKPIFAHQPTMTDYDGISTALGLALQTSQQTFLEINN